MNTPARPTRLLEETPSMQWANHVGGSRMSKLVVAALAVAILCLIGGFILGLAVAS